MAVALRPVWTGQIRLALVTLPVKLFAATSSVSRVALHQIHAPSGQRIRYEKVAEGVGAVPAEEITKAYEYQKGRYVLLSDDEIAGLRVDSKKTIDLVQFVDEAEIDARFFDTPYFAAPDGKMAEDTYRVVRDALAQSGKIGLGQLSLRGRAHPVAVKALGKGLLIETLRFAEDLRKPELAFDEIADAPSDPELVALAGELIARKSGPFDPARFRDDYAEAMERLVQKKLQAKGAEVIEEKEAPKERGAAVIDLVEALRKSLSQSQAPANDRAALRRPRPAKPDARAPRRKRAGGG